VSVLIAIAGVVVVAVWIVSIVDIVRRRPGRAQTAGWILLVVLVPILGSFVYWLMRPPTRDEVEETVGAQADLRRERAERLPGETRFY
jgi:hypothetical protein